MGTCNLCPEGDNRVEDDHLIDHLRIVHPDAYGDGFEKWPDGEMVIYDQTLEPDEFG